MIESMIIVNTICMVSAGGTVEGGVAAPTSVEESDQLQRSKKKVRKQDGEFSGDVSLQDREEDWMTEGENEKESCANPQRVSWISKVS